jgi:galactose mutarotase-like enzyme
MTYELAGPDLTVEVDTLGAELRSIRTTDNHEYLWQGDPESWGGQAPVLFPIIGGLPGNRFRHAGRDYEMSPHGFARKKEWHLEEKASDALTFLLRADDESRSHYPFEFVFLMRYLVSGRTLTVEYDITNNAESEMLFSVGGHPGFVCPLEKNLEFSDYHLRFNRSENAVRYFKAGGVLTGETEPFNLPDGILPLDHGLFGRDAIILRELVSDTITLESTRGNRSVTMGFSGFPDFGIWSYPATPAPYVCLEPWHGVDSTKGDSGELGQKYGVVRLAPGSQFVTRFSITIG